MSDLSAAMRVHTNACFFVGIATNGLLLWLVLKRTPTTLRSYSRVLLQTVFLNLFYTCIIVCYGSLSFAHPLANVYYGQGWLVRENDGTLFTRKWNFVLASLWLYMLFFTQFSILVPFLYRYFALCRGRVLSLTTYSVLLAFTALLSSYQVIIMVFTDEDVVDPPLEVIRLMENDPNATHTRKPVSIVTLATNTMHIVWANRLNNIFTAIIYSLMLLCSVAILLHLRRARANLHDTATSGLNHKQQARQINAVLVVQALLPLVFDFVPTVLLSMNYSALGQLVSLANMLYYIKVLLTWEPVVNGITVLLVVRPYRQTVLGAIRTVMLLAPPPTSVNEPPPTVNKPTTTVVQVYPRSSQ